MLSVLLVTVREAVEVLLLLVATAAYLPPTQRPRLLRRLGAGAFVGALAGAQSAVWMARAFDPWAHALLTLVFGVFLVWMAAGSLTSNGRIGRWIRDRVDVWAERLGWPLAVAAVAAMVTFREAFEVAFFTIHQAEQIGWPQASSGLIGGLLLAALLPLLLLAIDIRAHLAFVFRLSALLLSYVGLGMVIGGLLEVASIAGWIETNGGSADSTVSEGLLVAMLMLIPVYFIVRDWWTETEDATLERVPGVEDLPRRDD